MYGLKRTAWHDGVDSMCVPDLESSSTAGSKVPAEPASIWQASQTVKQLFTVLNTDAGITSIVWEGFRNKELASHKFHLKVTGATLSVSYCVQEC